MKVYYVTIILGNVQRKDFINVGLSIFFEKIHLSIG